MHSEFVSITWPLGMAVWLDWPAFQSGYPMLASKEFLHEWGGYDQNGFPTFIESVTSAWGKVIRNSTGTAFFFGDMPAAFAPCVLRGRDGTDRLAIWKWMGAPEDFEIGAGILPINLGEARRCETWEMKAGKYLFWDCYVKGTDLLARTGVPTAEFASGLSVVEMHNVELPPFCGEPVHFELYVFTGNFVSLKCDVSSEKVT